MKLAKSNIFTIIIPFIVSFIAGLLWYRAPEVITYLPMLNWLPLIAIIVFLLTPLSQIRLPHTKPLNHKNTARPLKYFANIIIIQICLLCVLFCIISLVNHFFIPNNHLTVVHFQQQTFERLTQGALFPWPTIAALAALIGFYSHKQNITTSIPMLMLPKNESTFAVSLNNTQNFSLRIGSIFIFATVIGVTALMTAEWVIQHWNMQLEHGLSMFCFIICITLIFTVKNNNSFGYFKQFHAKKVPSCAIMGLFTILLTGLLLAYNIAAPFLLVTNITNHSPWFNPEKWHLFSHNMSLLWWIAWCAPIALYQAKNSAGLKLRTVILAPLVFPLAIAAILYYLHLHPLTHTIDLNGTYIHTWQVILCLVSSTVLIQYFIRDNQLNLHYYGKIEPCGKVHKRNLSKPLYMLAVSSAMATYMLSITGAVSSSLLFYFQYIPVTLTLYTVLYAWPIKALYSKIKSNKSTLKDNQSILLKTNKIDQSHLAPRGITK